MTPSNDWGIKKCLNLSLAILLATLGLVGLGCNVGLGETDSPKFNTPGYTLHASGCAMLVRKDVFF